MLLLSAQAVLRARVPLLSRLEALHFLLEDFVDVRHVGALVLKLGSEGRQLIAQNHNLALEARLLLVTAGQHFADLGQLPVLLLDGSLGAAVVFLFALQAVFVRLQLRLLVIKEILVHAEGLPLLRDESIAAARVLNGLLPL